MKQYLVLYLFFSIVFCVSSNQKTHLEGVIKDIKNGLEEFSKTQEKPNSLYESILKFQLPHILRDDELSRKEFEKYKTKNNIRDSEVCTLCTVLIDFLIGLRKLGLGEEFIKKEATDICTLFGIEKSSRVCSGVIDSNGDIFLRLVDKHNELIGDKICDILLSGKCATNSPFMEWNVTLPEGQSPKRQPSSSTSNLKILQITDLHYDPLYTPGKSNQCGEPLCCQDDQPDGNKKDGTSCGYWTDYGKGDSSAQLFEELLRQAGTLTPDIVYFTGDMVSHRVWSTSVENNTRDIKFVLGKLKGAFPNVPIYTTLGNHEPHPVNEYNVKEDESDEDLSTKWLYNTVIEELNPYLSEDAKKTLNKGGFYAVSPKSGLKVVAINSNVAYNENWWLIDQNEDPFGQLAWLVEVLKEAEENNESVHILSHFPPGDGAFIQVWIREFNKIVQRFANTITLQLNGHSHRHDWTLFYNTSSPTQVINKAFNGASVTSCDGGNPNFMVYIVEDNNFDLVDVDLWTFNLTQANLQPDQTPDWYKLYSFKNAYDLESLSLENMGNLVLDMTKNHSRLLDYHTFRYRNSDVGIKLGCDENCQKEYLCHMSVSYKWDQTKCEELKQLYDQNK